MIDASMQLIWKLWSNVLVFLIVPTPTSVCNGQAELSWSLRIVKMLLRSNIWCGFVLELSYNLRSNPLQKTFPRNQKVQQNIFGVGKSNLKLILINHFTLQRNFLITHACISMSSYHEIAIIRECLGAFASLNRICSI